MLLKLIESMGCSIETGTHVIKISTQFGIAASACIPTVTRLAGLLILYFVDSVSDVFDYNKVDYLVVMPLKIVTS